MESGICTVADLLRPCFGSTPLAAFMCRISLALPVFYLLFRIYPFTTLSGSKQTDLEMQKAVTTDHHFPKSPVYCGSWSGACGLSSLLMVVCFYSPQRISHCRPRPSPLYLPLKTSLLVFPIQSDRTLSQKIRLQLLRPKSSSNLAPRVPQRITCSGPYPSVLPLLLLS